MRACRIYQRVSTSGQDLERQEKLVENAKAAGYYVAGIYSEKISGTVASRPELNRLIQEIQPGDVVIAESIDRISRLPVAEGEALIARITEKKAKIAVPDLVDLTDIVDGLPEDSEARIVMESQQRLLLKLALHMARKDYEQRAKRQAEGIAIARAKGVYRGRKADTVANAKIVELRQLGYTIAKVASTLKVSESQVKLICKKAKQAAQIVLGV